MTRFMQTCIGLLLCAIAGNAACRSIEHGMSGLYDWSMLCGGIALVMLVLGFYMLVRGE